MTCDGLPPLPQKIETVIFTEIALPLIPEVRRDSLVRLGAIVRKKGCVQKYEPLTDSLRKIQWVKLSGLRACAIEQEIANQREPGAILFAPTLQIEHSLNVTDCIIHTKSALDSMAVFLTDLLMLTASGGDRDLKKPLFRESVARKDTHLAKLIKRLEPWLNELQDIRDEWIHRSSIRSLIIQGPSDVGILPIPRDVTLGAKALGMAVTKENFWSTEQFVVHHYSSLATLFQGIIGRSIEIEGKDLTEPLPIPSDAEKELMIFPTMATENMTITKMKVYLD